MAARVYLLFQKVRQLFRLGVELLCNAIGLFRFRRKHEVGKKCLALQAYALHLAQLFAPVVRQLQHEDIEVSFIVLRHPQYDARARKELRAYARDGLGIAAGNIKTYDQTIWDNYDLILYNDVYARFPLRKTARWMLMHGVGISPRMVTPSPLRKTVFDFDQFLVTGSFDAQVVRACGKQGGHQVDPLVVGLPFLDRLADPGVSREQYLKRLLLDVQKKTVLFAPHWGRQDLLKKYVASCVSLLQETGYNVIVKLHACSFNRDQAHGVDWRRQLRQHPGLAVDNDVDDIPALKHADVLITDFSSRAFIFMQLNKPVLLFAQRPFVASLHEERARLMRRGAQVAETLEALPALIRQALQNPGLLRAARRQVAEACFSNVGSAAAAVGALVENELGRAVGETVATSS